MLTFKKFWQNLFTVIAFARHCIGINYSLCCRFTENTVGNLDGNHLVFGADSDIVFELLVRFCFDFCCRFIGSCVAVTVYLKLPTISDIMVCIKE